MAHRAERIRKQKIKELEHERQQAELYSHNVNWHWNHKIAEAFGVASYHLEKNIDLTYYYDEMVRQYEKMRSQRMSK